MMELLHSEDRTPCSYTEDELDEVVRQSEAGGYASVEEVQGLFAKWVNASRRFRDGSERQETWIQRVEPRRSQSN